MTPIIETGWAIDPKNIGIAPTAWGITPKSVACLGGICSPGGGGGIGVGERCDHWQHSAPIDQD